MRFNSRPRIGAPLPPYIVGYSGAYLRVFFKVIKALAEDLRGPRQIDLTEGFSDGTHATCASPHRTAAGT